MRLLIKLYSKSSFLYDNEYHHNLQGFIYSLLKNSKYHYLHDKKGYKFFCFSNIFPFSNMIMKNKIKNLLISSPDIEFLVYIDSLLNEFQNKLVQIGNMEFEIIGKEKLSINFPNENQISLVTGTPIIIRIPNSKFTQYNMKPLQYEYYYWRREYPLELFISQLENSLIKKFNDFCQYKKIENKLQTESFNFFQRCRFKKQISTRVNINGFSHPIIGTLWEFDFEACRDKSLIEFALDAGLGERNSLGFGFMNLNYN